MCEHPHDGLIVLVEEQSSSLQLGQEGLDCAPHGLQLLEGDVLLLVAAALEPPCLDSVVEDCTPAETDGVAVEVGSLDRFEDRGAVVLVGHLLPPLEVPLELFGDPYGPRT